MNTPRDVPSAWLDEGELHVSDAVCDTRIAPMPANDLWCCRKLYGLTGAATDRLIETSGKAASSPAASDTPTNDRSHRPRSLYAYLRHGRTHPAREPLRESVATSVVTRLCFDGSRFECDATRARQVVLPTPLLSTASMQGLMVLPRFSGHVLELDLCASWGDDPAAALQRLCRRAVAAARIGPSLVCLSDRRPRENVVPVHALAATGAVHEQLVAAGLRGQCHILVDTGTAFDAHHLACLIACGATAVCPWLAWQTLGHLVDEGRVRAEGGFAGVLRDYRQRMLDGFLKILAGTGVATASGYRGTRLFEVERLADEVIELCFAGARSGPGDVGFAELLADSRQRVAEAWQAPVDR
ncbi:MAG TPA: glutamate synthase central domain-containing protein [Oleiagrimonas sp.]|nr:glutamate synthase central domain-containing protein [Oleiagrimonas sp.]